MQNFSTMEKMIMENRTHRIFKYGPDPAFKTTPYPETSNEDIIEQIKMLEYGEYIAIKSSVEQYNEIVKHFNGVKHDFKDMHMLRIKIPQDGNRKHYEATIVALEKYNYNGNWFIRPYVANENINCFREMSHNPTEINKFFNEFIFA